MEQEIIHDSKAESSKGKILQPTLEYGLVLGLVSIFLSLIYLFVGVDQNGFVAGIISLVFTVAILVWVLKNYRDTKNGGRMSYGRGLGIGTLSFLWASILISIYLYLLYTIISPESYDLYLERQLEGMIEWGMSEEAALKNMQDYPFFYSPLFIGITSFFMLTGLGFILSLIISAIYKSDTPKT